jgi:hypothetical protein
MRSETDFAFVFSHTQLLIGDNENVKEIKAGYKARTLSAFLRKPTPAAPPAVVFMKPPMPKRNARRPNFPNVLNFIIQFGSTHPSGKFEVPNCDQASQKTVREALLTVAATLPDAKRIFGPNDCIEFIEVTKCARQKLARFCRAGFPNRSYGGCMRTVNFPLSKHAHQMVDFRRTRDLIVFAHNGGRIVRFSNRSSRNPRFLCNASLARRAVSRRD